MAWDPQSAFFRLFLTQIALVLLYPILGEVSGIRFLLGGFLLIALYGGISVSVSHPLKRWVCSLLGICLILSYIVVAVSDSTWSKIVSGFIGAAFFWFIAAILMKHLFMRRSRVDVDLIYGAISVYLLIGVGFAELYVAFAFADPNAFSGVEMSTDFDKVSRSMSYFSFVTLTTLGYGDISPTTHYTTVLAYTEAIVGQLYLAILVARLVGTYIAQSSDDRSSD